MQFRPDVQGLRGVAVLLVVAYHAWPALLPGGYIGVDVFFVISGYLITALLLREIERTGGIDFAAFYARRIRRLLPAAALVIATTALLAAAAYSPLQAQDFTATAAAAALYVSNIWFAILSVDYLQQDLHQNLLLHTWSLGIEEQFYLLWPALLAASTLVSRRAGSRRAAACAIGGVCALSFAVCLWLTAAQPSWAFFSLPARAWELGAGALAVLLEPRVRGAGQATHRAMVIAGLLCIAIAAFAFSGHTRFPGVAALLPVSGAVLIILGGAAAAGSGGVLSFAPLQRLGDVSYAWYLWHWPVLILIAGHWPALDANLLAAVGVAVSLGLARLTYVFVEQPVRHHAALSARPLRTFAAALALSAAVFGILGAAWLVAGTGVEAETRHRLQQAARDRPRLYQDKCFAAARDIEPARCVYGAAAGDRTVVLIGDSHAAQWFPAFERLAQQRGWRLQVFVKAACPLAAVEIVDPKLGRPYTECTQWREQVMQRIERLRPALVVGTSSGFYEPFVTRDRDGLARWQRGLEQSLARLRRAAGHVVLIKDTPRPGFNAPSCLAARAGARDATHGARCTYWLHESVQASAHEVQRAAAAAHGVAVLDMTPRICAATRCPVERDGVVLFHDAEHLSATFARALAEPIWQQFPAAVRDALAPPP